MRMNAPTGVCKSASTERTTGTTLPCRASRSNASNEGGWRSSISLSILKNFVNPVQQLLSETRTVQPMSTINNQDHAVNKACGIRTDKHRGLLDVGNSSKTSHRNLLQ